jgi:hypothetical protein
MSARISIGWATTAAALLVAFSAAAQPHRPTGAPPSRLNYSTYQAASDAAAVISALRAAEEKGVLKVESFALLAKDASGKVTILDRRQPETRAGGTVASVVALVSGTTNATSSSITGGSAAFLVGSNVRMSRETMNKLKASLLPGETAVVTVVEERWGPPVGKLQELNAQRVFTHLIPGVSAQAGFDDATRDPQPDRVPKSQRPTSPSEPAGPGYRE